MFQNVEQTDYEVDKSKTTNHKAKVGDKVNATSKDYKGFTESKPLPSKVIPVDDTLNLQVKYNRNTYKLKYDTNGGSYLPTEIKVFGAKLNKPEDPKKSGYKFLKWVDESGNEFDFTNKTMPYNDVTLKAVWIKSDKTPYRIAYYVQNADDDGYTPVAFVTKEGKTGDAVMIPDEDEQDPLIKYQFPGMKFWDKTVTKWMSKYNMTREECEKTLVERYFKKAYLYNIDKTNAVNENMEIAGDGSTVLPLYFDRQVYTMIVGDDPEFYKPESKKNILKIVKDGVTYDTKDKLYKFQVRFGQEFTDKLLKPEDTPDLMNDNAFIGDYMVLGDYDNDSWAWLGDHSPYILGFREVKVQPWTGVGAKEDKNFPNVLWLAADINDKHNDLKVYEHFQDVDGTYKNDVKTFTIPLEDAMWCYEANHKGFTKDQSYMTGVKKVKTPIINNKPEYIPETSWAFLIKRNTDNPAKVDKYEKIVTIDGNGNEILSEPEPKGYDRKSDGEVHAYYKRNQYNLRFHYEYKEGEKLVIKKVYYDAPLNTNLPDIQTVNNNRPKNLPEEYEFQGWYSGPEFTDVQKLKDDAKMPDKPIDLYAKWATPLGDKIVTIDPDNNTGTSEVKVKSGEKLDEAIVGIPKKAGYDFVAWRVDKSQDNYDFNRPVYKNFTLKAVWKEKTLSDLTIKFVKEDGTEVKAPIVQKNLPVGEDYSYEAPDVENHWPDKIVKKINIKADSSKNILTFTYKTFTTAKYSMRFITRERKNDKDNETEISDIEQVITDRKIDTKNAKDITGYEPLTLQQTLRLAWDQENIMTFVYKKAKPEEAGYRIEYYFDKKGDGNFTIDKSRSKDYSGKIGSKITLGKDQMPELMDGFILDKSKSITSGTITSKPTLVLKVYYGVNKHSGRVTRYTITVDPNGGNWDGDNSKKIEQYYKGEKFILPKAPVKNGYIFQYWYGSKYNPGDKYTVIGDHTFTAVWKKMETSDKNMDTEDPNSRGLSKHKNQIVITGDNTKMMIYAGLSSGLIAGLILLLRKKKSSNQ